MWGATQRKALEIYASPARQLCELGAALLDSGVSVTDVATSLNRAAAKQGLEQVAFSALPELVVATVSESGSTLTVQAKKVDLLFSQSAAVNRLARRVEMGEVAINEISARVDTIRAMSRSFGVLKWILGTAFVSLGLAVLFRCPWWAVALVFLTGGLVGALIRALGRIGGAAAIVPFVTAFVSTIVIGAASAALGFSLVPLFAVCAPVAILVPGALITNALLELTATDIVTGSARLMYGIIVLGFMVAGIAAGGSLTGLRVDPDSVALVGHSVNAAPLGPGWQELPPFWSSWIGVVILALGVGLALGSGWMLSLFNMAVMTSAYALLTALTPLVGSVVAVGVTAGSLFVAARLIEHFLLAAPATVTFLPAFLLLVPGTVGLVALATFEPTALISALLTFVSLCIGTKVGDAISELFVRRRRELSPRS